MLRNGITNYLPPTKEQKSDYLSPKEQKSENESLFNGTRDHQQLSKPQNSDDFPICGFHVSSPTSSTGTTPSQVFDVSVEEIQVDYEPYQTELKGDAIIRQSLNG
jgi:hypothetical protein